MLFDLDGVLVDSRTPFARSINAALVAHGITTIGALWGIGSEAELRDAGADHLVDSPARLAAVLGLNR